MGQIVSRKNSNSMKGTPEPTNPLTDMPELYEKYAIMDEKFSQLISQKEQVPTRDVIASSPIYSRNLVEDLKQKLKESNEVCDETLKLNRSLSFLHLADEKEKAQLTFTQVADIRDEPDKNKALEEDVKSHFSKLLRVSNSLINIEEKKTQLEEERAAIIEKHGEELAKLNDLLAAKPEELTTEDRRILSVMEATETLQPQMQSLKQRLNSYEEIVETAPQRTLHYYETTKNVAGNCSTSSSFMDISAEYNFEVARPKSSTNLFRTITTDVEIHSLSATEKSTLLPIAVGATNERPAVVRTYQRKIRAREPEAEAFAPRAKRRKIAEPEERYRCADCGKTYRQYKSLSMHIKEDCDELFQTNTSMFPILPMGANQQRIGGGLNFAIQGGNAVTSGMSKADNFQQKFVLMGGQPQQGGNAITSEISKVGNFQQKFVLMGGQSQQISPWVSYLSPAIGAPMSSAGTASTVVLSTGQQVALARDASSAMQMETNGSLASGVAASEAYTLPGEGLMSSTVQSSNNERGNDLEKESQAPSEAMTFSKPPEALDVVAQAPKPTSLEVIFADIKSIVESKDEEIKKLVDTQLELSDENNTLRSTTISLREELQWKEDVVTDLARKVERLDEQIAKLHVKKFVLKQQLDKYRLSLRARNKRISGLKGAVEMAQKTLRDFEVNEKVDDTEEVDDDDVIVLEVIPFKRNQAAQREAPLTINRLGSEASQRTEIQPKPNTVTIYTITPSGKVELRDLHPTEKNSVSETAAASEAGRAFAAELGLEAQADVLRARGCTVVKPTKSYVCNGCDKRYYHRKSLVMHKNYDCDKAKVSCDRCQRTLRPRTYQPHLQRCVCDVVEAQA